MNQGECSVHVHIIASGADKKTESEWDVALCVYNRSMWERTHTYFVLLSVCQVSMTCKHNKTGECEIQIQRKVMTTKG